MGGWGGGGVGFQIPHLRRKEFGEVTAHPPTPGMGRGVHLNTKGLSERLDAGTAGLGRGPFFALSSYNDPSPREKPQRRIRKPESPTGCLPPSRRSTRVVSAFTFSLNVGQQALVPSALWWLWA